MPAGPVEPSPVELTGAVSPGRCLPPVGSVPGVPGVTCCSAAPGRPRSGYGGGGAARDRARARLPGRMRPMRHLGSHWRAGEPLAGWRAGLLRRLAAWAP